MEGNQKRRWDRLRKLLRLLVGRRKKRRFTVPDQSTCIADQSSTGEDDPGSSRSSAQEPSLLPPESARLAILSPSDDILASLNKFRLSTAASRENLMPQTNNLVVFDTPMPKVCRKPSLPAEERPSMETSNTLASTMATSNTLAEQRWKAGSSQCLANLNSWPSRLSLED